jgi:hypothetical protein
MALKTIFFSHNLLYIILVYLLLFFYSVKEIRAVVRKRDETIPTNSKVKFIEADVFKVPTKMDQALSGATHVVFAAAGNNQQTCIDVDNNG